MRRANDADPRLGVAKQRLGQCGLRRERDDRLFINSRSLLIMSPTSKPILVTGASGFLAIHTIIQLLQQGYKVRGTLRSLARESEVRETLAKHVQANDRLEFVTADLLQDAGWDKVVEGCEAVLHVASPFPLFAPKDEDELIVPAVQGTQRVLRAAHDAKIKRVV